MEVDFGIEVTTSFTKSRPRLPPKSTYKAPASLLCTQQIHPFTLTGHPVLSQVYIRFGINFLDSLTTCFGLFSLSLDLFSLVFVVFFFLIERKRC